MKPHIGDTLVLEIMKELMVYWKLNVFGSLYSGMHSHVQCGNEEKNCPKMHTLCYIVYKWLIKTFQEQHCIDTL